MPGGAWVHRALRYGSADGADRMADVVSDAAQPTRNSRRGAGPEARRLVVTIVVILLALVASDAANEPATAEPPTISVSGTIIVESPGEAALAIRVGPTSEVPRNSFVTVRGLPSMAALSEGYAIAPGSWAVPLSALPDLKVKLPAGLTGRADIIVALVAKDGAVLFEARTALMLGASASAQTRLDRPASAPRPAAPPRALPSQVAGPGATASQPPPPAIVPQDRERALRLMRKGDDELAAGLVAPARLLYERAADLGLAQAAMALAATYDAAELTSPHLRGVPANDVEAKRWYERARLLGAGDADQRLQRLGAK